MLMYSGPFCDDGNVLQPYVQYSSHCELSIWNVATVTEELNFLSCSSDVASGYRIQATTLYF